MMRKLKIESIAENLKGDGVPYVLATVVRTVAATAAKAGAKALILEDGTIVEGWIGGGCARGAVLRAAKDAISDGEPRLISVQPEDLLAELGVAPGQTRDGVRFARNMCPSKGTMDVFIEPVLPLPHLFVLGASPVGVALADLARRFGFYVIACAPSADQMLFVDVDERIEGYLMPARSSSDHYIVVATQGRGDEAALRAALASPATYVAFVGSRAKAGALKDSLRACGIQEDVLARVKAPAGLDIGAVTPEEIALSIVVELVAARRKRHQTILGLSRPEREGKACPQPDDIEGAANEDVASEIPGIPRTLFSRVVGLFGTGAGLTDKGERFDHLPRRSFCCM